MSEVVVTDDAVECIEELLGLGWNGLSSANFRTRLQNAADKEWESGKTIRFENENGGGWAVDVSRFFSDHMLYLIVGSQNGKRVASQVIDENQLEGLLSSKRASPQQEQNQIPITHRDPPVQPVRSDEPTLIRRITGEQPIKVDEMIVPFGQVAAEVQAMLSKGVKPEEIEIWTRRQRPRVKVELE